MDSTAFKGGLGAKLLPPRVKAIRRERLECSLAPLWDRRLGLVVGPAGSGKTTLLTQFATGCDAPVAWYRADGHDASPTTLVHHLERAFCAAMDGLTTGWRGVEGAVDALAQWNGSRALLVVDDLHLLEGTAAEAALERLIDDAPPAVRFLVAGRSPPRFNLPRLRVSGALLELGPDDLRFRSWEVEHLFRDFYHESLSPEDLAALARRTEGWAAGLQLFHLATTGKPPRERCRVLHELGAGSRVVREYLARNVLDELPPQTSQFLLNTSVLGYLTGPLCDALLETTGSAQRLADLEKGQVFTAALDDAGTYRYHEVLRSHLEAVLVQRLGEDEVRLRYGRAARLLEAAGAVPEAVRAYARAGDEDALAALLGARGEEVVEGCGAWVDGLPPALVASDPWLRLAEARRCLAAGRWQDAHLAYRSAERLFGAVAAIDVCRRERLALGAWLQAVPGPPGPPVDWTGVVRAATHRNPIEARHQAGLLAGAPGHLAAGLATLLAGYAPDASALFARVLEDDDASPLVALGARLAALVAKALSGDRPTARDSEDLALEGERLGAPWLARLARGLIAVTGEPGAAAEASMFRKYCEANDDPWGSAIAAWLQGLVDLDTGTPTSQALEAAEAAFRGLGADVLAAWALATLAVAQAAAHHPGAHAAALRAQSSARVAGVRGAQALALRALAISVAGQPRAAALDREATALAEECGLRLDTLTSPEPAPGDEAPAAGVPPVVVRGFGTFAINVGDVPVDCSVVKPRARTCLRLLAMHAGRGLHKETLVELLWPGIDARSGLRNLHVVISALRQLLEPGVGRGASSFITRDGDSYQLVLPPGSESDLISFETAIKEARAARAKGDRDAEMALLRAALDHYSGDLLPDAGPAEWVVAERERYRVDAADSAESLAAAELERGDPAACAAACERGLRIDRHRDQLWRLRIEAGDRAGDRAGSASARLAYDGVLAELGIGSDRGPGPRG